MNPIAEAILLNNKGASLLDGGRAIDAIHQWRKAVHVMSDLRSGQVPDCWDDSWDDSSSTIVSEISHNQQHQQRNRIFVFCRPLRIPTNVGRFSSPEDFVTDFQTTSCYIFFNLAIACHQYGMASGLDAPLLYAMEFYQSVLTLQSQLNVDASDSTSHHCMMQIQCLVMNNLAHIHSERCEYHSSRVCFDCVIDLIFRTGCLEPVVLDVNKSLCLTEYEAEEIKLNFAFCQTPTVAQAA